MARFAQLQSRVALGAGIALLAASTAVLPAAPAGATTGTVRAVAVVRPAISLSLVPGRDGVLVRIATGAKPAGPTIAVRTASGTTLQSFGGSARQRLVVRIRGGWPRDAVLVATG